ncbi:class I SAM-dependent methyltransferase [Parvibaculaceae bacterium PLY_AMNH_Bact1]|nr:class I SAM-dependent methyltransferase [Parvibaculaceae bacterium PLY_AMNH_Bact1]
MTDSPSPIMEIFKDPAQAARYSEGPIKFVPGFSDIHRMVGVLINERASKNARILVHGAGGGLELEAFALANPSWTFLGVDPAKPMLDAAGKRLGPLMERIQLHHGYIYDAPEGPFNAATSLLTLHFLDADEYKKTVKEIVRRLNPGAPFIAVHSSFPESGHDREVCLSRYSAFASASGVDPEMADRARNAVSSELPRIGPEQNVALLQSAGLKNVESFYSGFAWHGWVGYA